MHKANTLLRHKPNGHCDFGYHHGSDDNLEASLYANRHAWIYILRQAYFLARGFYDSYVDRFPVEYGLNEEDLPGECNANFHSHCGYRHDSDDSSAMWCDDSHHAGFYILRSEYLHAPECFDNCDDSFLVEYALNEEVLPDECNANFHSHCGYRHDNDDSSAIWCDDSHHACFYILRSEYLHAPECCDSSVDKNQGEYDVDAQAAVAYNVTHH